MRQLTSISPAVRIMKKKKKILTEGAQKQNNQYSLRLSQSYDRGNPFRTVLSKNHHNRKQSLTVKISNQYLKRKKTQRSNFEKLSKCEKNSIKNFIKNNYQYMIEMQKKSKQKKKLYIEPSQSYIPFAFQKSKKQVHHQTQKCHEFQSYSSTIQGTKGQNQDKADFSDNIYVLCDGHGEDGKSIANFVSHRIHFELNVLFSKNRINKQSIQTVFENVDYQLRNSNEEDEYSGCTCVALIAFKGKIFCASVGDSKVIMKEKLETQQISIQHKPQSLFQRKRILQKGGVIKKSQVVKGIYSGPVRVWAPGKNPWGPGLSLSRAFGDRASRDYGIISRPQINIFSLSDDQKFFVLGSDGLFDKMANEEVTDFIEECLYEKEVKNCELPDLLTKEVKSRWKGYQDDITTIVVLNMTSLRKNSFYHIDK